jgi:hypothetical protein
MSERKYYSNAERQAAYRKRLRGGPRGPAYQLAAVRRGIAALIDRIDWVTGTDADPTREELSGLVRGVRTGLDRLTAPLPEDNVLPDPNRNYPALRKLREMITRGRIEAKAERYDSKSKPHHEKLRKLLDDIVAELAAPHHAKDQTLAALRKGIIHRREVVKATGIESQWHPSIIQAVEADHLLDWIEDRLDGILPPPLTAKAQANADKQVQSFLTQLNRGIVRRKERAGYDRRMAVVDIDWLSRTGLENVLAYIKTEISRAQEWFPYNSVVAKLVALAAEMARQKAEAAAQYKEHGVKKTRTNVNQDLLKRLSYAESQIDELKKAAKAATKPSRKTVTPPQARRPAKPASISAKKPPSRPRSAAAQKGASPKRLKLVAKRK